jgi:4-hydroxy-3-methylbut-2-enyl diphosphate reductase
MDANTMKLIIAEHAGMCFGVRDAIQLASEVAKNRPVTILGDLAHNADVVRSLSEQGIASTRDLDQAKTKTVMITAHGASNRRIQEVRDRGHEVVEATCPLVKVAHEALHRLVLEGYHPVIIGRADHVEVLGMTGDLEEYDLVLTVEDVNGLNPRSRFGVVSQTTQPVAWTKFLVETLKARFPESEVRHVDTVCRPTKQRQIAAEALADDCDVVVVVGGVNSNNTSKLAETCGKKGAKVYKIQSPEEIQLNWFSAGDVVGLTGGTSTPPEVLKRCERVLSQIQKELLAKPKLILNNSSISPVRRLAPAV